MMAVGERVVQFFFCGNQKKIFLGKVGVEDQKKKIAR